ncbi:efflux RND transporter permease subunit [Escherichia coli]
MVLAPGVTGEPGRMFIRLKDWSERDSKTGTSFAIIERATKAFNKIKEARVIASSPPAISGLGSSAGFDMELQDHAGAGHDALMAARNQLLALAAENPELTLVRHNGLDDSPQLQIDRSTSVKLRRWASLSTILTTHCKPPGVRAMRMTLSIAVA